MKYVVCFLLGGCKFKGSAQCTIDDNDMVTISETCYRCGKIFSFQIPYSKFGDDYYNLSKEQNN